MTDLYISKYDLKHYCNQYPQFTSLTPEQQIHITDCLTSIIKWYNASKRANKYANDILGGFLTAVVNNKFVQAITRADSTNLKCIAIYAFFMNNQMPIDYTEFIK